MYFRQVLRFVLILSLVVGCFPVVWSQSLLELVPQEATKITLLRGIPAMEVDSMESTGRLQELLGRSNKLGMKEDAVIFEVSNDSVFARFLLLQPNGAFEPDSIRSILKLEESSPEENAKGVSYYKEDNFYVAWNATIVLTGMVNPKYYYYEEENYYNDSYEDVDPESDKLSLERANELFDRIFVPDPSTSMKFLEEELEPVATSDIVYINTINERMYLPMMGRINRNLDDDEEDDGFFSGYAITCANFKDGHIDMQIYIHQNPLLNNFLDMLMQKGISPALLKYINGEDVFAFTSLSVDAAVFWKQFKKMQMEGGNRFPGDGPDIFRSFLPKSLMWEFIDFDKITDLFPGEIVMALTGIKEMDVRYVSYDMVEGQVKKVTQTRKEMESVRVIAFTTDDEETIQEILGSLVKNEWLIDRDGYYEIRNRTENRYGGYGGYGNSGKKERMFLRMDGEVIVVTNDRDILKDDFNGYKGNQSVFGELKDLISSRGLVIWGDITRLSEDERDAYTSGSVVRNPLSNLGMRNSDIFTGSVMYGGNLNDRVMEGRVVFESTPSEAYYEFIESRIIQF